MSGNLSTSQKAALAKNTKSYANGAILFNEGDPGTELFLLIKGKVAVLKGGKQIAEITEPMSYFGEMSLLLHEPRSATIKCIEDCEFMVVPGDKLEQLIDVSPAVGKKLLFTLAQRLSAMNRDRMTLTKEVLDSRKRAQEEVSVAAQDYKRMLYAVTLVYQSFKLPQVAELLKYGKDGSMLASHSVRMDLDDRHFMCSPFILKLHQDAKK